MRGNRHSIALYHTRGDVLELVDVDVVAEIGEISGRILQRLAIEGRYLR